MLLRRKMQRGAFRIMLFGCTPPVEKSSKYIFLGEEEDAQGNGGKICWGKKNLSNSLETLNKVSRRFVHDKCEVSFDSR